MKSPQLLVFDSHPVQYRVPVWQALEALHPGCVHVVYASDCSVRGFEDKGFGCTVAWDEPMLSGYSYTILNSEKGTPLSGWGSLSGEGVSEIIKRLKPAAILLTGFNYRFDLVAYMQAIYKGIPVWMRCETQDQASSRSKTKSLLRSLVYRTAYISLDKTFYIGELNKYHYLKHGISLKKLRPARYGTVDRFSGLTNTEKEQIRNLARAQAGVAPSAFVIGFSGKFIAKKNPDILFEMLRYLPDKMRRNIHLYFMGSGAMEIDLQCLAEGACEQLGVKSHFAGFVNQSQLTSHYLSMDLLVLPSRRQGETWGLVANEALQAGCGVIVSNAVGCSADFAGWERFRVFKEGSAMELAACVSELVAYPREYGWALQKLTDYSIDATAYALLQELKSLCQPA
ncbi:glycosyltransferase [Cesiribacter sp. SM1]|uniref:glycosyltransferase n=1 Tax=Cesiribacter sp. SM1 TaxID=2861196 RepID=UPI001CD531A4|nr:glycosyltransferase [Cesiribacter sp. SM1]